MMPQTPNASCNKRDIPIISLSPREVATSLGCSHSTLRKYMREEGLPFSRVGRRLYIAVDDLRTWLEQRREAHEE